MSPLEAELSWLDTEKHMHWWGAFKQPFFSCSGTISETQPSLPAEAQQRRLYHPVVHAFHTAGRHVLGVLLDQPISRSCSCDLRLVCVWSSPGFYGGYVSQTEAQLWSSWSRPVMMSSKGSFSCEESWNPQESCFQLLLGDQHTPHPHLCSISNIKVSYRHSHQLPWWLNLTAGLKLKIEVFYSGLILNDSNHLVVSLCFLMYWPGSSYLTIIYKWTSIWKSKHPLWSKLKLGCRTSV